MGLVKEGGLGGGGGGGGKKKGGRRRGRGKERRCGGEWEKVTGTRAVGVLGWDGMGGVDWGERYVRIASPQGMEGSGMERRYWASVDNICTRNGILVHIYPVLNGIYESIVLGDLFSVCFRSKIL